MALLPGKKNKQQRQQNPEAQMELVEHLAELRTRILRTILYIIVGMFVTYNQYDRIFTLMEYPLAPILSKVHGTLVVTGIQDAFLLKMQVCLISGLVVACPFIVLELWGFIAPALTSEERKPVRYLAPFSVLLFLAGVVTAYAALPTAYGWMASYIPDIPRVPGQVGGEGGATLFQNAQQYLLLTVKILLAFGVSFQLPIVLLFLARVGLITAELMQKYWRHATVGIATAAAILTPSNDPMTMLMMAVPMAGLYMLSIGLVRAFEPRQDGTRTGPSLGAMLAIGLAPVAILIAAGYWLWRNNPASHAEKAQAAATAPAPAATPTPAPPAVVPTPAPSPTPSADIEALKAEVADLNQRITALEAQKK